MSAKFTWTGLEELKAQLRSLPEDLVGEASGIVKGAGEVAAAAIEHKYREHAHTGELANGVVVKVVDAGQFGVAVKVVSAGKLAQIWEQGSETRHYITVHGKTKLLGKMPPGHFFVPEMVRRRRAMYLALAEMLERHGLQVTGDGG